MDIYSQIAANKRKAWLIIVLFVVFIATIAFIFGKAQGGEEYALSYTGIALIFSGIMSFISYYNSDKMILAMSNAHQIQKKDNPQLFNLVENLCIGDGLPMPKVYIIHDTATNAFATGRDPKHAVICFTTGILEKLSKVELEGVIAHELSHIKNFDIRLMAIITTLVGLLVLLGDVFMRSMWYRNDDDRGKNGAYISIGIVLALLAPLFASLFQLAISRRREFLADASGALLTRYPDGLASALEKISKDKEPLEVANNATAHLYIANPFKDKNTGNWFAGLFNTHPPIEERIKILRSM